LEALFQQVLDRYPDKVKLVIKQFPLARHKYARKAAQAALAANVQGKFWEFHNKLFENYQSLDSAKIQDMAKELGFDMNKFAKDIKSAAIRTQIMKDIVNGKQVGVRGTPTVFINCKLVKTNSLFKLYQVIAAEIGKKE